MGTVVSIDYSEMRSASNAAKRTATQCQSYANEIQRKVTNKLDSLKLGSSSDTSQANYFAQKKIRDLNSKKNSMEKLAAKIDDVREYAKETDQNVASYIRRESVKFRQSHDMKVGVLVEFFTWLDMVILNSNALDRFFKEKMTNLKNWVDEKKRKFKQWWELEGGKYIVKTAIAIVGTIVAVIFLFCAAIPALVTAIAGIASLFAGFSLAALGSVLWTVITAAATFTTAIVAVADGLTKSIAGMQAVEAFEDDPGWARRYDSYSSFTAYLRKNNFHDGYLNKLSYIVANKVDTVATIASVINLADTARRGISFYKSIKENGRAKIFWKVKFTGKNGKVTWGTFKYGLKRTFDNVKVAKTFMGNTNISRITQSFEKAMKGYEVYKGIKNINKWMSNFNNLVEKGTYKYSIDAIKSKIKENTITFDYLDKIKSTIDNIKSTTTKIKNTPNYVYS